MSNSDIESYFGVFYTFLFFFCAAVVIYYAEPGFPWHSYITIHMAYYCSLGILLLVPIDIATCVTSRRSASISAYTEYQHNTAVFSSAYQTFFYLIVLLGTFVLVYEEYYNTDGKLILSKWINITRVKCILGFFTVPMKLANSFKRMMIDTFAMIVAGLIVLAILLGQNVVSGFSALQLAIVIVTNGIYEFFLMFLLSYGLVEFPVDEILNFLLLNSF